jgi:hypothetical protein
MSYNTNVFEQKLFILLLKNTILPQRGCSCKFVGLAPGFWLLKKSNITYVCILHIYVLISKNRKYMSWNVCQGIITLSIWHLAGFNLNIGFQNNPPDLSQCVFVIEQALSVRALQELMASGSDEAVSHTFNCAI